MVFSLMMSLDLMGGADYGDGEAVNFGFELIRDFIPLRSVTSVTD